MRSLGIDVSTSATGIVLLDSGGGLVHEQSISFPKLKGIQRSRAIVTEVMQVTSSMMVPDDKIVLEGYSLNMKNAASVIPLVEIGALLRFMLQLDGLGWYDPRAGELKEFVTGKGNSPKSVIMMWVLKRWGHTSIDDNTADAYGCAMMGLTKFEQMPGMTKRQKEIAAAQVLRCN
jgi:Holliday junction resolvasome RuvABC endonuclease subunit